MTGEHARAASAAARAKVSSAGRRAHERRLGLGRGDLAADRGERDAGAGDHAVRDARPPRRPPPRPSRRRGGRASRTRCPRRAGAGRGSRRASRPGRPRSRRAGDGSRACRRRARRRRRRGSPSDAPTAAQTAERSSDGSAWQSAPPIVPRLRTTGSAITRSASVKIASRCGEQLGLEQRAVARHARRSGPRRRAPRRSRARRRAGRCRSRTTARRGGASSSAAASDRPASSRASGPSCGEQHQRVLDARGALVAKRCRDLQDRLLLALLDTHLAGVMVARVKPDLRDRLGHRRR